MSDERFQFHPTACSAAGFSIEPLQELTQLMATAAGNGNLPGAVLFLARGDQVVLHQAFGSTTIHAGSPPLRTDAVYRLHSMTKPLTAVAMLLLYEQGAWDFDEPVAQHIPEMRDFAKIAGNQAVHGPLIRHLFTHTSGHSFGSTLEEIFACVERLDFFGAHSHGELIRRCCGLPLRYEPGTRWEYSIAMEFQAAIVERISGMRYDRFLEERVFAPLGMVDSGFMLAQPQRDRLVPGYAMDAQTGRLRPGTPMEMQDVVYPLGGSSMHSTAADYARFARMLLNHGALGGTRLLKEETAALMFRNLLPAELQAQQQGTLHLTVGGGNGFSLNGRLCIDPAAAGRPVGKGTYEWAGAHGPFFWVDPEHDIVCVGMTNRAMPHPEMAPLSEVAQDLVYRALKR